MMRAVKKPTPLWLKVLRVLALVVTLLSIVGMLYPDSVGAPLLAMGLAGQFLIGTVLVGALAVEILLRVTGDAS
jgi:hypothetical protein